MLINACNSLKSPQMLKEILRRNDVDKVFKLVDEKWRNILVLIKLFYANPSALFHLF